MNQPKWNSRNRNRIIGDTTYDICGWCNYRGSGLYKHDCMLEGKCTLLHRWSLVSWDTHCLIRNFKKKQFDDVIVDKKREMQEYKDGIVRLKKELYILRALRADRNKYENNA
jgi:hypothetical protein